MNFSEAAKMGLPFKRKNWKDWIVYNKQRVRYEWETGDSIEADMRPEWFQEEDWEVDWPPVEIKLGQFYQAMADVLKEYESNYIMRGHNPSILKEVMLALGRKLNIIEEKK
jgi:hypothetical protein